MMSNFVKASIIAGLGCLAYLISMVLFLFYKPDISMELIGGVSLAFPAIAYLYIHSNYKEVFWKSFFVGTGMMLIVLLIALKLYLSTV